MTTTTHAVLGATLRTIREDRDLNQIEAAHAAHVDGGQLCRIEYGNARCTRPVLGSLCNAYGITPRHVLTTAADRWHDLNPNLPSTGNPLTDFLAEHAGLGVGLLVAS